QRDTRARYGAAAASSTWATSRNGEHRSEQGGVSLLNHKQRYVQEGLCNVESVTATQDIFAIPGKVIRKAHARTESLVVVLRNTRKRTIDRLEQLKCTAASLRVSTHQIEVAIVSKSGVQVQLARCLPIILE